jgi:hypothetical protein
MDPERFLDVAQELSLGPSDLDHEAQMRTSVNRAYLAALLVSAVYLQTRRHTTFPRSHEFYYSVEEGLAKDLGSGALDMMARLRSNRSEADYDLQITLIPMMKTESMRLASNLTAMVKEKL